MHSLHRLVTVFVVVLLDGLFTGSGGLRHIAPEITTEHLGAETLSGPTEYRSGCRDGRPRSEWAGLAADRGAGTGQGNGSDRRLAQRGASPARSTSYSALAFKSSRTNTRALSRGKSEGSMQNAESCGRISLALQTAPPRKPIPPPATSLERERCSRRGATGQRAASERGDA